MPYASARTLKVASETGNCLGSILGLLCLITWEPPIQDICETGDRDAGIAGSKYAGSDHRFRFPRDQRKAGSSRQRHDPVVDASGNAVTINRRQVLQHLADVRR